MSKQHSHPFPLARIAVAKVHTLARSLFAGLLSGLVALGSTAPAIADSNVLVNGDFEDGTVRGWQTQGNVTIVSDGVDAYTNGALKTVGGGARSARIGDERPWQGSPSANQNSSIAQEALVPAVELGQTKVVMQFAYAVVANDPPSHREPDKPLFRVLVQDLSSAEVLYDTDQRYTSQTSGKWYLGTGDQFASLSGADRWVFTPWQAVEIDLTKRVGHRIRMEFIVRDCNLGAHAAYGYLDHVGVGSTRQIDTPQLIGNPPLAPFVDPGIIDLINGFSDLQRLPWWLLCCLLPLLALLLLSMWLISRSQRGSRTYSAGRSAPSMVEPEEKKQDMPGFRPGSGDKDKGGGGFRPGK